MDRRTFLATVASAAFIPDAWADDRPCHPPKYLEWTAIRERRWRDRIGAHGFVNYYGEPFEFDAALNVVPTDVPTCAVWGAHAGRLGERGNVRSVLKGMQRGAPSTDCHTWPNQSERDLYAAVRGIVDQLKAACPAPRSPAPKRYEAVGSHHSSSDVYKRLDATPTAVVRIDGANQLLTERAEWRAGHAERRRDELGLSYLPVFGLVGAGLHVCELNEALWERGLALETQGSFDGQTLAGAISTGTHGAGARHGAIADSVEAVVLVTAVLGEDGQGRWEVLQIEPDPDDAITDRQRFVADRGGLGWRLIQDTALFEAAIVGMGTMGVIVGYVMRIRTAYFLREFRVGRAWSELRGNLVERATQPATGFSAEGWRYELVVNPNPVHGVEDWLCTEVYRDAWGYDLDYLSSQREIPDKWVGDVARTTNLGGALGDYLSQQTGKALVRGRRLGAFADRCYRVLKLGQGEFVQAWGTEFMIPADRGAEAVEWILAENPKQGWLKRFYPRKARLINPFGVRFCRGRRGWLSPTRRWKGGEPVLTCTIELTDAVKDVDARNIGPQDNGKPAAKEIIADWADRWRAAFGDDARLHWGQVQGKFSGDDLRRCYPAEDVDRWTAAFCALNPFGLFDTAFAERLGFVAARAASGPKRLPA
jgi:hypothetical protein